MLIVTLCRVVSLRMEAAFRVPCLLIPLFPGAICFRTQPSLKMPGERMILEKGAYIRYLGNNCLVRVPDYVGPDIDNILELATCPVSLITSPDDTVIGTAKSVHPSKRVDSLSDPTWNFLPLKYRVSHGVVLTLPECWPQ